MKNYFTDEQVEEIAVNAGFPVAAKHMKEELRTLMNLAVEAAIVRVGTVECADVAEYSTEYWGILHEPVTLGEPLYSVKELEN